MKTGDMYTTKSDDIVVINSVLNMELNYPIAGTLYRYDGSFSTGLTFTHEGNEYDDRASINDLVKHLGNIFDLISCESSPKPVTLSTDGKTTINLTIVINGESK